MSTRARRTYDGITQNMTGGDVTAAIRAADVALLQETPSEALLRRQLPDHELFVPRRKPNMAIAWRPELFEVVTQDFTLHHGSGQAEGFLFATPPRGSAEAVLRERQGDSNVLGLDDEHWINAWDDPGNQAQARVIRDRVIPTVERLHREWRTAGYATISAGDFNCNGRVPRFPGLELVTGTNHDRVYLDRKRLELVGHPHDTEKTGVGSDWYHAGVAFTFAFTQSATAHKLDTEGPTR